MLRAACGMAVASSISVPVPAVALPLSTPPSVPPLTPPLPDRCSTSWLVAPKLSPRPLKSTKIPKNWASATSPAVDPPGKMWLSASPPLVGRSASGRTPYVVAATAYARARGAYTAAVSCNQGTPLAEVADIAIIAEVGAEVISGSTRMKAASAQKMILNMITTGAMTRLGYVYENLMVNVHMQNSKLVERGIRILMNACKIDRETAVQTIKSAGRSVPVALVMLKAKVDKPEAVRRLAKSDGNVRLAIEDNVLEL
jgi:NACalpha-BTF3-like transcription factor